MAMYCRRKGTWDRLGKWVYILLDLCFRRAVQDHARYYCISRNWKLLHVSDTIVHQEGDHTINQSTYKRSEKYF